MEGIVRIVRLQTYTFTITHINISCPSFCVTFQHQTSLCNTLGSKSFFRNATNKINVADCDRLPPETADIWNCCFSTIRKKSYGKATKANITIWTKTCTSSSRCSRPPPRPTPGWVTLWRRSRSFLYRYVPFVPHIHTLSLAFTLLHLNLFPAARLNHFQLVHEWSDWWLDWVCEKRLVWPNSKLNPTHSYCKTKSTVVVTLLAECCFFIQGEGWKHSFSFFSCRNRNCRNFWYQCFN